MIHPDGRLLEGAASPPGADRHRGLLFLWGQFIKDMPRFC
jgi:hypothetical protein